MLAGIAVAGVVETGQITHAVVGRGGHDPGIAAIGEGVSESIIVLEKESRMRTQSRIGRIPVHRKRKIDVEICHHRLAAYCHVGGGGEVRLFQILQLTDECLLRRAAGARIPLERALVNHDCERETGMLFSLCHHQLGGLIDGIAGPVPVDDDAVNSAADHVLDLIVNLRGIVGVVADVHVVGFSKPQKQVCVDLGRGAGIEQRVNINLADIGCAQISV